MRNLLLYIKHLLIPIIGIFFVLSVYSQDQLTNIFHHPPQSAKPWVYWYWMNGNITHEGIEADLKAMSDVGVGGAYLMDIGNLPPGDVLYGSDEWFDLVGHAVKVSKELDIDLGFHSPGWSQSGGPWITAEMSMKELTWTETIFKGGVKQISLTKPKARLGFYRDIAIVAFPCEEYDSWITNDLNPIVTTVDGSPLDDSKLLFDSDVQTYATLPSLFDIKLSDRKQIQSLTIRANVRNGSYKAIISAWDDQNNCYVEVGECSSNIVGPFSSNISDLCFKPIVTDRIRVELSSKQAIIEEISLSASSRITRWSAKAGFCAEDITIEQNRNISSKLPLYNVINPDSIIILTDKLRDDGLTIDCDLPDGNWVILRMGYIPTGVEVYPAPVGGSGLECDKMSKVASGFHYKSFISPLLERVDKIHGGSIKFHHLDSYEAGWQNWTDGCQSQFTLYHNYDIIDWIPALMGRIIKNRESTERFLWDFRNAIGNAFVDNHFQHLVDMSHQDSLLFSNEPYGGPFNFLKLGGVSDRPMVEFWMPLTPSEHKLTLGGVFSGRTNGRKIISAEAFTSGDPWTSHPFSLKAAGDFVYASGVNHFTMHVYAHQPLVNPNLRPGFTVGGVGIQFNRNNTWWDHGCKEWVDYMTRCQALLQQGEHVADVLYFCGDESPADNRWMSPPLPLGYDFDVCSNDVFMDIEVGDGDIIIPSGKQYKYLVLPHHKWLTTQMLEKTLALLKAGANIIGEPVGATPSQADYIHNNNRGDIVDSIWGHLPLHMGRKVVGQGKIIWNKPWTEIFIEDGIVQDFTYNREQSPLLLNYSHRVDGQDHIYFIANGLMTSGWAKCRFRAAPNLTPYLWDAKTGTIESCKFYSYNNQTYEVPLYLNQVESKFIVFRKHPHNADHIVSIHRNGEDITSEVDLKMNGDTDKRSRVVYQDSFVFAGWVRPNMDINIPQQDTSGVHWSGQNWIVYPSPGHSLYGLGNSGVGISAGKNGVAVFEHWENTVAPLLTHRIENISSEWYHIIVSYNNGVPTLHINGEEIKQGFTSGKIAHSSFCIAKNNSRFCGEISHITETDKKDITNLFDLSTRPKILRNAKKEPLNIITDSVNTSIDILEKGEYEFLMSNGAVQKIIIKKEPIEIKINKGWKLELPKTKYDTLRYKLGRLISLSDSNNANIKYFSGTSIYKNSFMLSAKMMSNNKRIKLDLGEVLIIAEVFINDKKVATLWSSPFDVDITKYIKKGKNKIEILVTNQWVNRMIGDEYFTSDVRYSGRIIAEWPDWIKKRTQREESSRVSFSTFTPWSKEDVLLRAGLIGPVKIKINERLLLK